MKLRTFTSLRHRDFRFLWTGTVLMSTGQWIQHVTLGWLTYEITGSSVLLGAINGFRALPFLFSGPIAGVAADRMDQRKLLMATQYVLLVSAVVMGGLVVSGFVTVWHLFVFTFVTGITWAFHEPVRQAMLPFLVPRQDLVNAVAINSAGFNSTKVLGPALGGVLIAWFGAGGNFFVQAATYLGVLAMLYSMRFAVGPKESTKKSALADLKEGVVYVWSTPVVFALVTAALVPRIFATPYQVLMPVFQKDVFDVGPEGLGMLMAAPGLGGVLAVLALASFSDRLPRQGLLLLWSLICLGLFLLVFSRIKSFSLAFVALTAVGACQILFMATTNTLLHLTVPDYLRGRVMSIYMLDRGLTPAGAMLAGTVAHFVGAPTTVGWMGSVVIVLAALLAWRVPLLGKIRT
jgi:MFS family permease